VAVSPLEIAIDKPLISTHDGTHHLTLIFQSPATVNGGDLSLWCDIPLAGTAQLEGLSPDALFVVNTDIPGHIRVSFADPDGLDPDRTLRLTAQLESIDEDRECPIILQGKLYDRQGQLRGEIFSQQTVHPQRPTAYVLHQNYPNPTNPSTTIRYALPEEGRITLSIFNVSGQQVRTLVNEWQQAGTHAVHWDGKDESGREAGSGIYLCRMKTGAFSQVNKMVLLR